MHLEFYVLKTTPSMFLLEARCRHSLNKNYVIVTGSEIKKLATSKRAILEKMKDDVGHLQSRLDETSQAVNYAAGSGDAIALLSVRKGMSHHMATLLKLKCQVPNPSHKLNIQVGFVKAATNVAFLRILSQCYS